MSRTHQKENLTQTTKEFICRSLAKLWTPVNLSLWLICALLWQSIILSVPHASAAPNNSASPQVTPAVEVAAVRHAPVLNGRIEGSVRQLTGESVTFNSGAAVTGDLMVPGTPTVRLNGSPNYGGTINGTGSIQPTGYFVTLNSGSMLGRLVKRTDAIALADVAPPPASTGTRSVVINSAGQSAGDFSTLRDLTLNGNIGLVNVPPGTYRNFTANGGGFVLGVAGSTQPAVYNLSRLTLNSGSRIQIVGPVVLTLGNALTVNSATVGASSKPSWLTLRVATGGVTLNGGSVLYGVVRAPYGLVTLNAPMQGSVHCDRLVVNSSGSLTAMPIAAGTLDSLSPARAAQGQTLSVTLTGRGTNWRAGQTLASFGGEVSVGEAAPGESGLVTVVNETTAIADLNISSTAALGPRTVRVVTPLASGGTEDISLTDAFTVIPVSPPGASSANVTTIAGNAQSAGFADGPAAQSKFRGLAGIASGPDDSIYVADAGNNRIRIVRQQAGSWVVQTLAGDGTAGYRDGAGAQARFNNPQGVAVDASGAVYVADTGNHRIRRIAPDGTVATVAGDGTAGYQNGAGAQARFNGPRGVALDAQGNLYVADTGNSAVRFINSLGEVQTVAGDGTVGMNDSPNARFNGLAGVVVDKTSVFIYLADTNNHRIRRLDPSGSVITLSGAERGFADGSASDARFAEPMSMTIDGSGNLVIADSFNSLMRSINLELAAQFSPQAVSTLAGTGERGWADGAGNVARFSMPRGVAATASGAIIVADTGNNVLRRIAMPPAINFIYPARARAGQAVTINGARFDGRDPARNIVKFAKAGGGQTTAQVLGATQTELSVVVPADAATGSVTVQTEDGTATSPEVFEVYVPPAPTITDFNPKQGAIGSNVTITGTALKVEMDETRVTFAGTGGTRLPALVSSSSDTEVRVIVPNAAMSGLIELTTAGGTTATATPFTVESNQDFEITVAPSTATAVQRSSATFVVSLTSSHPTFTQMGTLSASGLPGGVGITFDPEQITNGARSTLQINLANVNLSPGSYPFTINAAADLGGREEVRTASATLNVMAAGQTTLAGRVLSSDAEPIMGATASLDGRSATTDAAGAFILTGVTAGTSRPLMVDGRTASSPNRTYPVIIEPADIVTGQANVVPYIFYLPPIDIQAEVDVIPGSTTVAGNQRVPGLQMTIPAGANLRNRDGSPVARVSITPLAIDRTPAPLPSNVTAAMVYTSQPGGALTDVPIPVVYPNLTGANPNTRVELYAFNHDTVQWYVYGYGRVSADGRTIAPEINPNTGQPYGLPDFSWHFPAPPPDPDPKPDDSCPTNRTGEPVDLASGTKIEVASDIAFGGARGGLSLTRTYTSGLAQNNSIGRFGRGTRDNYDIRLTGTFQAGGAGRFVNSEGENGDLFSYSRTEGGALIFTTTQSADMLGDTIARLSDGTLEYRYLSGGRMRFDSTGRLIAIIDRNGNTTTLNYSGSNLTTITDAVGRTITLTYDGSNRITSATDPLNRRWAYEYNSNGMLIKVTDPLNQSIHYTYDAAGRLLIVKDPRGTIAKVLTYDGTGRVATQRYADGGIERYDYTFSGNSLTGVTVTDQLGRQRKMRMNAAGYVIETVDELGQQAKIERDITTNVAVSTTGPCGCSESTRQFNAHGNVTSRLDRLGQTMNVEYEPGSDRITKITDQLNRVVTFVYDARGNMTSTTDALNQTTRYEYNSYGQLVSITDPLNHVSRIEYDDYGNVKARIDALNHRSTSEPDAVGRILAKVDALGRRSTAEYDALDRVVATTASTGVTTRFVYDANSNLIRVTDALNRSLTATYDAKNRPTSLVDPLGRVSRTEYDVADQVTATISPLGRTTRNTYDHRGQLATMTDPLGNVVKYKHDSRGNLISITDHRGYVTTFSYDELFRQTGTRDPLGRESSTSYDAGGNVTAVTDRLGQRTTYTYDAGNRPKTITFTDAMVTYTYDAASRVTRIDDTQSGSVAWTYDAANRKLNETTPNGAVGYTYNEAGEVASMVAADRAPVNYGYDEVGRLKTISQGAEVFTYGYDSTSRLVSVQRPNGVETRVTYDAMDRTDRLSHVNTQGQFIEDYRFSYNADDQIRAITSLASVPLLPTAKNAAPANASNRIMQFSQASYSFDDRGMTTTKSDAQGVTNYQWDARGRLARVTLPDGKTVNYGYDAMGRLASRSAENTTTSYLYDGADVVLDRTSDGAAIDYLNGNGVDAKLRQTSAASGALYYLTDHLGSTVALTGGAGSVVERMLYEPYGETNGSALTRYGFTGREKDNLTGLMYYRARWYDPQQGRFISEDPAGFTGGLNKYAYVSNNPISKTDPLGLYEIDVHYFLTHYLARQTGCFDKEPARRIANGDQRQDELKEFSPGPGKNHQNEHYHAFGSEEERRQDLANLWEAARHGTMNERLNKFGQYMHYFQDTFSHRIFHSDTVGQAILGMRPDKPHLDVDKAMDMARQSFEKLKQFAKELKGCECEGADGNPDWDKIRKFFEYDTGGFWDEINAKQIRDLRNILTDHLKRPLPPRIIDP